MSHFLLAADGVMLTSPWVLGALGSAGAVIAALFKLLIASKDRLIASKDREIDRLNEDFTLFKEQIAKDELRRDKEDERLKLLIEETMRLKKLNG